MPRLQDAIEILINPFLLFPQFSWTMSTTSGNQPMTLRPSWRSTSETWAVQAADAVDHVAAGAVAAVAAALVVKAALKPPGRSVEEGLTR